MTTDVDAKAEAIARPFQHSVIVRPTGFRPVLEADSNQRIQFQDLYRELIADRDRNEMIREDVLDRLRLSDIAERCGRAVHIEIVDIVGVQVGVSEWEVVAVGGEEDVLGQSREP